MLSTLGALIPIFLLIGLGWLLRERDFPGAVFWPAAERLVYWLLFPALLLLTTANTDLESLRVAPVAAALIAATLAIAGLTFLLRPWLALSDASFSSVFQGAIRNNIYVGLAGGGALFGSAGLAVIAIAIFVVVTTVNLLSVIVLLRFGNGVPGPARLVGEVAKNPLIVACLAGFFLNATGMGLPPVIAATFEIMGSASLPLGLLCVGAGLDLSALHRSKRAVLTTSALKLLAMPAATALFCRLFGVEGITAAAAILFTAAPIAASSYVLARQLGGDAPLIAGLITITTLAAIVTMPLVLVVLT